MRAFTSFFFAVSAVADPVCTELPAGTYRAPIGYNTFLTIKTMSKTAVFVGTELAPGEMDEVDAEKYSAYVKALNGIVHLEVEPDCSLKISDAPSANLWRAMFMVLSDYMGQYAAIEGLVGKYDASSDSIVLGGWLPMPRDK